MTRGAHDVVVLPSVAALMARSADARLVHIASDAGRGQT